MSAVGRCEPPGGTASDDRTVRQRTPSRVPDDGPVGGRQRGGVPLTPVRSGGVRWGPRRLPGSRRGLGARGITPRTAGLGHLLVGRVVRHDLATAAGRSVCRPAWAGRPTWPATDGVRHRRGARGLARTPRVDGRLPRPIPGVARVASVSGQVPRASASVPRARSVSGQPRTSWVPAVYSLMAWSRPCTRQAGHLGTYSPGGCKRHSARPGLALHPPGDCKRRSGA